MAGEHMLVVAARPSAPERTLRLQRPHTAPTSPLRAWSAADELVVNDHELRGLLDAGAGRLLIVNDEFGALTCGFGDYEPTVWSDSALSRRAIQDNLAANDLASVEGRVVAGNKVPTGSFDAAVMRVPKSAALARWQLGHIAALLPAAAPIVGAAMARHISRSTRQLFEAVGETDVSLATRKARLIRTVRGPDPVAPSPVATSGSRARFSLPDGTIVVERPGVFSAGHVDSATALLLAHVQVAGAEHVLDLGCGNGVIAATLARQHRSLQFTLLDVSDLAIEAAGATWEANQLAPDRAAMIAADGTGDLADNSFDLVVSNPPFHQGHAVDEALAERLLRDCARLLRPAGCLVAVGQRDLHLHTRLRKWFGSVRVLSKHPVFVVVEASDPV